MCKSAVEDDGDAIFDVPMRFRTRELYLLAIDVMCDNPFECFPKEFINDESFLKEMIDTDWTLMEYVPEKYMTKENAYKVLQKDTYLYMNIDEEILKELSDVFEIIKTSHRDVYVIKLENGEYRFSIGCQINITKDEFINKIHHDGDEDA